MSPPAKYTLDLGYARIELYEDYLIATINEGVVFDQPHFEKFNEIFDAHYYNRPFGYISNRKYDYTVNPTGYKQANRHFDNLVGIATLCYSEATRKTATFAAQFFDYPHEAFFSMEECVDFINTLLEKKKSAGL